MIASRPDHFDLYTPHLHCHHVSFLPARSNQPPAFGASYLNVCIPANEENEDYEQLRDLSISRMHDIYANASAVLILDPDLWCLPGSATATEIMIKFVISAHAARLWTYQETTLCSRVYALGKDCIHDLRGLSSQLDREALVGCISNFALGAHQRLFGLGETTTARELDPNQILYAIQGRASSRSDDECICIATLMGINTEQLTAAAPVDRMAILLRSMSSIPVATLFAFGPRVKIPGLRWAPKSFLTAFYGGISSAFDRSSASRFTAHLAPKDRGLCTDMPAIKLGLVGWWDPDGRFHCALGSTMLVFRAFNKHGKWEKKSQLELLMLLRAHHQARDLQYLSGQIEIETYDGPPRGPETELAVLVLSNPAFSGQFELGVMVELRHGQAALESTCTTHEDVVVCNCCCVVQIWRVDEALERVYRNVDHELRAEWIPSRRWLVDGPSDLNHPTPSTEDSGVSQKRPYDHGDPSPPHKRQDLQVDDFA